MRIIRIIRTCIDCKNKHAHVSSKIYWRYASAVFRSRFILYRTLYSRAIGSVVWVAVVGPRFLNRGVPFFTSRFTARHASGNTRRIFTRFFYGRARAREKAHLATMLQIADRKHKYRTFNSRSPEYASLLLRRQVQLLWGGERRLQFRVLFYATRVSAAFNLLFEELNSAWRDWSDRRATKFNDLVCKRE